jgi:hypothetical protein
VGVVRIVLRDDGLQLRVLVLQMGQLGLVEWLEDSGLDLALEKIRTGHDDVVPRIPGQQLRLEHLVRVEDVVADLDPGFLLEILEDLRLDVVRPVVDIENFLLGRRRSAGCGIIRLAAAGSEEEQQPADGGGNKASRQGNDRRQRHVADQHRQTVVEHKVICR